MGLYTERGYDLETAKYACSSEIQNWHDARVLDVFDCNVLGSPYRYYCSEADQLRMINGKVANTAVQLMCGRVPAEPDTDPTYEWVLHTSTEAGKVHTDYVQFSKDTALQYQQLKVRLAACTTVEQVEAIFYELY